MLGRSQELRPLARPARDTSPGWSGHHRVSIAAATRQRLIDAYVTEVLTAVPPGPMNMQQRPGPGTGRKYASACRVL